MEIMIVVLIVGGERDWRTEKRGITRAAGVANNKEACCMLRSRNQPIYLLTAPYLIKERCFCFENEAVNLNRCNERRWSGNRYRKYFKGH